MVIYDVTLSIMTWKCCWSGESDILMHFVWWVCTCVCMCVSIVHGPLPATVYLLIHRYCKNIRATAISG